MQEKGNKILAKIKEQGIEQTQEASKEQESQTIQNIMENVMEQQTKGQMTTQDKDQIAALSGRPAPNGRTASPSQANNNQPEQTPLQPSAAAENAPASPQAASEKQVTPKKNKTGRKIYELSGRRSSRRKTPVKQTTLNPNMLTANRGRSAS